MRRSPPLVVAVVVLSLAPFAAFAEDIAPTGDAPRSDSSSSSSSSTSSKLRQPDGLFDRSAKTRRPMLSFFGYLPFYYGVGFGVGARYTIPIVDDGFIPELNDSVELEFGADFQYAGYGVCYLNGYCGGYFAVGVPAEGRWTFHITDRFSAYGKVGIGINFGFNPVPNGPVLVNPYPIIGPGVLYRLGDGNIYLRGEVGTQGVKGGIGIGF